MKKFFLATGILIVTTVTATYAQDNSDNNNVNGKKLPNSETLNEIQREGTATNQNAVSAFTINQFATDYPDVTNIHFEKTKDYDKVAFTQNGIDNTAYYDDNNELVGTLGTRSMGDLPASAQKDIANRYPNYTVVRVIRFNANSDNETYIDNNSDLPFYGELPQNTSNYFVELENDNKAIVLMVALSGEVSYFTTVK